MCARPAFFNWAYQWFTLAGIFSKLMHMLTWYDRESLEFTHASLIPSKKIYVKSFCLTTRFNHGFQLVGNTTNGQSEALLESSWNVTWVLHKLHRTRREFGFYHVYIGCFVVMQAPSGSFNFKMSFPQNKHSDRADYIGKKSYTVFIFMICLERWSLIFVFIYHQHIYIGYSWLSWH